MHPCPSVSAAGLDDRHRFGVRVLFLGLPERNGPQILRGDAPAPVTRRVAQVVIAHERGVLRRLVGGEVRHEAPVAEGARVAVDDEHAASGSGQSDHLALTAIGVEVAAQQTSLAAAGATPGARGRGSLGPVA